MEFETIKHISIGILIGMVIGTFITVRFSKEKSERNNVLAFTVALLWVVIHLYAFFIEGQQIDIVFNAIGGAALGDVIGIKIVAPIIEKVIASVTKSK